MSEGKSNPVRLALITGASQGLGAVIARALAKEGFHTLLLARQKQALEKLYDEITAQGGQATGLPMDLTDFDAIDRLGATIYERWGRLDALVANAGVLGELTPTAHLTSAQLDATMQINFTANHRLIRALESLLLASEAGRAVFITSSAVQSCRPFFASYSASKAALDALVKCWAAEHANDSLRINLLNPNARRTAMRAQAQPAEDPASVPEAEGILPFLLPLLAPANKKNGEVISCQ